MASIYLKYKIGIYRIGDLAKAGSAIRHNKWGTSNWRDKAGGYGIQEPFGQWAVKKIEGDYDNVVGLPLRLLREKLIEIGIDVKKELK